MRSKTALFAASMALLVALAMPSAVAEPPERVTHVDVAPPPQWQNATGDGYYLRVTVFQPQAPHGSDGTEDCARDDRPRTAGESAGRLAHNLTQRPPDPFGFNGVQPWFPECVAITPVVDDPFLDALCPFSPLTCPRVAPPQGVAAQPYVAWNVASGEIYVETSSGPAKASTSGSSAYVVHSPIGTDADCIECPPGGLA